MDNEEEKKKAPSLEESVIEILRGTPNLRSREIAEKASSLLQREVDRTEINRLFYGKLKCYVTQDKGYRWQLCEAQDSATAPKKTTAPPTALLKLCKYYLDCLSRDDIGVSLFRDSRYGEPDYYEIGCLPTIREKCDVIFRCESVQRLISKVKRDQSRMTVSIGYPVRIRHIKSTRSGWAGFKVEPLFIFPMDIEKTADGLPEIQAENLRINSEALKGVAEVSGGNVLEEIAQLTEELGIDFDGENFPEVDELAMRMQQIRPEWNWQEDTSAEKLATNPPISGIEEDGLYNRAIVFVAERSPYTQGLETELEQLSKMNTDDVSGTALQHWLAGYEGEENSTETDSRLLEVIPLNEEQRMAVRKGLKSPLSVITGPPGTGKSQVVTSMLLNAVWKGQKVLFASKNNKAVDVVEVRANGLSTRPIVMRLGSNTLQEKLAEYLGDFLSMTTTAEDEADYNEKMKLYDQCDNRYTDLENQILEIVELRNRIDKTEQAIEVCRKQFGDDYFTRLRQMDLDGLDKDLSLLESAVREVDYAALPTLKKIIWKIIKKKSIESANAKVAGHKKSLNSLNLEEPAPNIAEQNIRTWRSLLTEARVRYASALKIQSYFEDLAKVKDLPGLPDLIKDQVDIVNSLSAISGALWEAWLKLIPGRLNAADRRKLQEYTATLKLIVRANAKHQRVGREVFRKYYSLLPEISNMFPCWAITSLSVRSKVPFEAGFFDVVVIDEASQCDIASALPLLYRAKRAVMIGDPKQLRHISNITQQQDIQLLEKHGIFENFMGWIFSETSLYDLAQGLCAPQDIVTLRDHHRSHADIISYSNKQFYGENLRVATHYDRLKPWQKTGPAILWEFVKGHVVRPSSGGAINETECQSIKAFLLKLMRSNYDGSIGVVTPFRAQANKIRDLVHQDNSLSTYLVNREFLVDTVHKFQGDERDIMIFSPVISENTPKGAISFLRRNGNLFNVAITRARSTLMVIGDKAACESSDISYLTAFCQHVDSLNQERERASEEQYDLGPIFPEVSNPEMVSDWEKILYRALYKAGIKTMPQYSVEHYRLDLAYKGQSYKLDIEVDGERYHRNWDGELCRRDKIRNRRLIELGWDVMRFWVYEIRDDLKGCVKRAKERIEQNRD